MCCMVCGTAVLTKVAVGQHLVLNAACIHVIVQVVQHSEQIDEPEIQEPFGCYDAGAQQEWHGFDSQ